MNLVMKIAHKTHPEKFKQIVSVNPTIIPRKGDRVDMGYAPAPTVTDVLWLYNDNQTDVYVIVG